MNNMLEYKGYHARIEFDSEDMIFVGTVFGINDSLSFHGSSVEELQNKFSTCIDNYLLMCSEIGKEPEKEFRGSFNVRIDPELHKEIAYSAYKHNRSMNKEIEIAISDYLDSDKRLDTQPVSLRFVPIDQSFTCYSSYAHNSSKAPSTPPPTWLQNIAIGG